MKSVLAFAFVALSFAAVSAHADVRFPDQEYVTIQCRDDVNVADGGFNLEIIQGGIAGLTTAHLFDQSIMGPVNESRVIVRQRDMARAPMGAPLVFTARNFRFDVNFTVSPIEGRYNPGHLKARIGSRTIDTDLLCNAIYHTL